MYIFKIRSSKKPIQFLYAVKGEEGYIENKYNKILRLDSIITKKVSLDLNKRWGKSTSEFLIMKLIF